MENPENETKTQDLSQEDVNWMRKFIRNEQKLSEFRSYGFFLSLALSSGVLIFALWYFLRSLSTNTESLGAGQSLGYMGIFVSISKWMYILMGISILVFIFSIVAMFFKKYQIYEKYIKQEKMKKEALKINKKLKETKPIKETKNGPPGTL